MTTIVHVPLYAGDVEKVRRFIDRRFVPMRGQTLNVGRLTAHAALDDILAGNFTSAKLGIEKLANDEARELRDCLTKNNIVRP